MEHCKFTVTPVNGSEMNHPGGTAFRIEVVSPATRCMLKTPEHWPKNATALRWIRSGGSAMVLGVCDRNCPETKGDL
jgi:hypothetical protein